METASVSPHETRFNVSTRPRRSRPTSWVPEALVCAILIFLSWQGVQVWQQNDTEISHFPQALDSAVGPRPPGGYTEVNTRVLNRGQPGRQYVGSVVRYVGKNTSSTGPYVASINAINRNTFAAAALGNNGRCYAELAHSFGSDERYGQITYAKFAKSARCSGSMATAATVTSRSEPQ